MIINNSVNINLSGQLPHLSNPLTKISPRHIRWWNPGSSLVQAQKCGGNKPVNEIY